MKKKIITFLLLVSIMIQSITIVSVAADNNNVDFVENNVVDLQTTSTNNDNGSAVVVDRYGSEVVDAYETFVTAIYDDGLILYYSIEEFI